MPIDTVCNCGKRLRVADEHAGKKARCPQCGAIYVVPSPTAPVADSSASATTATDAALQRAGTTA